MNREEISSVLLNNGNILFSYRPYEFKETWFLASFPCLVSFLLLIIEWLNSKTCYSIALFILSIPLFLFLWLNIRDRRNKKIEESLVNYHLQDIIEADIKRVQAEIEFRQLAKHPNYAEIKTANQWAGSYSNQQEELIGFKEKIRSSLYYTKLSRMPHTWRSI